MREVVVFGGNGFIGKHLTEALLGREWRVRVASRSAGGVSPAGADLRLLRADVSDRASVDRAVDGASIVFHLASGAGSTWSDFEREAVGGATNVGESCLAHGVKRLIYVSSSAALFLGGKGFIDESHGVDAQPEKRSLYSRAKIESERVLQEIHRDRKLPLVILRPAVVVGKGGLLSHGGLGMWPSPTRCVGRGRGDSPIPFVLAKDVVQALVASMEAPGIEGMAFNLAGDVRFGAREFVALIARRTARDFRFAPRSLAAHQAAEILKWMVKAAGRKRENPFPSWRDLSSRTLARQIDNRLAKRHLGWIPTNDVDSFLEEAIGPHVLPMAPGDPRAAP